MTRPPATGVSQAAVLRLFPRRLALLIGAFGLSVAAAVPVAAGYHFHQARAQAITAAEENARNLTRALADTVARTIQSVEIALTSVAEPLAERQFAPGDPVVTAALYQRLAFTPYLRQILVVAADGRVVYDTAPAPARQVDLTALFGPEDPSARPLIIGGSQAGRYVGSGGGTAQQFIPLGRPIRGQDGALAGMVIATVNPLYFEDIFQAIQLNPQARLALWLFDGRFLAGDPPADAQAGRELADRLRHAEFDTFQDSSVEPAVVSYRTTLNWPVVVSMTVPLDQALAAWRHELTVVGLPMAAMGLLVLGLTGLVVRSLLQRARHDEALRLSDRVLASISNGVTIADATAPDNPLVYANPAFERITGYPVAQALGRNLRFLHQRNPEQPGLDVIRGALSGGGDATAVLCNERADGTLFWNELTIGTVRDQAGHITHFVGVQRDITEQKEASERLRLAYDDIARFSRDLERFAFVLAHHLQEPARLQGVFSEQLTRLLPHPLTEEQCECLGHIRRGARQLRTLLHDVENYISLNRGAVAGECSADAALDAALRFVSGRLDEVGATLHREPLQPVKLAQPRLTQVFRHMLDNAIEYREPDRPLRIAIRCTVAPSHITIHIADNGIGIDPDYLSRIFEVFERLHTHDEHDGTGMGLAVTHRIIELAGGRVWATSVPQEGTTLHVRLPRASGPAA